jgi:hypothetical protein
LYQIRERKSLKNCPGEKKVFGRSFGSLPELIDKTGGIR